MGEDLIANFAVVRLVDFPPFFDLATKPPEVLACRNVGITHVSLYIKPGDTALSLRQGLSRETLTISLGDPQQAIESVLRLLRENPSEHHEERCPQSAHRGQPK